MKRAPASDQLIISDFIAGAEVAQTVADNPKAWADLVAGDVVEVWWSNGVHFQGRCASIDERENAWEVEAEWVQHRGDERKRNPQWHEIYSFVIRFMGLYRDGDRWGERWRFIGHDAGWSLHPTSDELAAWLKERLVPCKPYDSCAVHMAMDSMWPRGTYEVRSALWTEALLGRWPDPREYLVDKRWLRHKLPAVAGLKLRALLNVPTEQRVEAIRALRWRDSDTHDGCLSFVGINDDYELWHMAHTDDALTLLQLAECIGISWVPRSKKAAS